jgi:flagellar hook-basal body complex protein FliE
VVNVKLELVSIPRSPSLVEWSKPEMSQPEGISFSQYLGQAIQEVDSMQKQADQMALKVVTGEINEIHQATIAAEKASLSLQLALQIRSKVVEAYQEIMRMPV